MKKVLYLLIICCLIGNVSCTDKIASGIDNWYYVYIAGDSGKQVQITYLQREKGVEFPQKNVSVTENVTLPCFKEIHTVDFIGKNLHDETFLKIQSNNDSTTRAIIFDNDLRLKDSICGVMQVFYPENAVGNCSYCNGMAKDSVLIYLRSVSYPCYIEFAKADTCKQVRLHDWWSRNSK